MPLTQAACSYVLLLNLAQQLICRQSSPRRRLVVDGNPVTAEPLVQLLQSRSASTTVLYTKLVPAIVHMLM